MGNYDIEYIEKLEKAFLDVLDGGNSNWWEIQQNTGLPEKECKEIEEFYREVWKNYKDRHNFSY